MKFSEFKEIVTLLYNEKTRRDNYIDRIPREFSDLIVDNVYTSSLSWENDKLCEALFGDMHEDVFYFIYETHVRPNDPEYKTHPNIFVDGREYCVYDLESYFDYVEKELFNVKS